MGYGVMPEISRAYISQGDTQLGGVDPWRNLINFSREIWKLRVAQYESVERLSGQVFFDRSLLDTLSYFEAGDVAAPEDLNPQPYPYYPRVFIFPPWPDIYTLDGERWESQETSEMLHQQLVKTYEGAGYELFEVPRGTVEERCKFILDACDL